MFFSSLDEIRTDALRNIIKLGLRPELQKIFFDSAKITPKTGHSFKVFIRDKKCQPNFILRQRLHKALMW